MGDILPPINNPQTDAQFRAQLSPGNRRNAPLNKGATFGFTAFANSIKEETHSVDEKLNEQFKYFRMEYVEAANVAGVAVPLGIVEDKSGQVYKFVLHGGPKYLFDVMQSNIENIHLVRCSLSLLIIIITLLRRKLPDPFSLARDSIASASTSDSITAWVMDTLAKMGDAAAVSVCVNVLISSYNPSVQELSLSLLASLLSVSDEAVRQMLLPYSSTGNNVAAAAAAAAASQMSENARKNTATKRGHSSMGFNGEITNKSMTFEEEHEKPKVDFSKLNFSYNTMDYSSKKVQKQKKKVAEKHPSYLAYVLSVILLQKNRHLLCAGAADVVIAMLRKNRREVSEAIAQTATCALPAMDERSKNDNKSKSSISKLNMPEEKNTPHASNPLTNVIIEWAGLKLLLKFLFRYEKMNVQSKTAPRAINRESVSAALYLKDEFSYSHSRVFTAVCQLISSSEVVALQCTQLEGAEDLIVFTYNRFDPNDMAMYNTFVACTNMLAQVKNTQVRRKTHLHLNREEHDVRLSQYIQASLEQSQSGGRGGGGGGESSPKRAQSPLIAWRDHSASFTKGTFGSSNGSPPGSPKSMLLAAVTRANQQRNQQQQQVSVSADSGLPGAASRRGGRGANGNNNNNNNNNNKSRTNSVVSNKPARLGSEPRMQVQSETIELAKNVKVNFQSEYPVQTEKRELYLLNSYDAKYGGGKQGTELKNQSRQVNQMKSKTPLSYNPKGDTLLGSSLDVIGNASQHPITQGGTSTSRQPLSPIRSVNGAGGGDGSIASPSQMLSAAASSSKSTASRGAGGGGGGGLQQGSAAMDTSVQSSEYPPKRRNKQADADAYWASKAELTSQDFFDSLPSKPAIPTRIEAKDAIIGGEDLDKIRAKFKQLAEEALGNTKGAFQINYFLFSLFVHKLIFFIYIYLILLRRKNK
jgi:hypothetical protein